MSISLTEIEGLGHALEPDEPMTFPRRWACTRCGDEVLAYSNAVHGAALLRTCSTTRRESR